MGMLAGELAKKGGVNFQTLRYYERRGLLLPTQRKSSGYRLYDEESLQRLHFIKEAQDLGFSLEEIGDLLKLRSSTSPAKCGKVMTKAEGKLNQIEDKVAQLTKMAEVLRGLIADCRKKRPSVLCPILACCEPKAGGKHVD